MTHVDIIVVGSGPTGVSAAFPLVAAGLRVLMLDGAGQGPSPSASDQPTLAALRTVAGESHRTHLLGRDLAALRNVGDASPKLRTAAPPGFGEDFDESARLSSERFRTVGAIAAGGLSQVWGASVSVWDAQDFCNGFDYEGMRISYRRVVERIGVSGANDDPLSDYLGGCLSLQPPLPLSLNAQVLMDRAADRRRTALTLGRSRNAVLTTQKGGRQSCTSCRSCMWGCRLGAVYCATHDLAALADAPNFERMDHGRVVALRRSGDGWAVRLASGDVLSAQRVILAAGVLTTTRLVLEAQGRIGEKLPLLSNPAFAFAAFLPKRLGARLPASGFGLAQLAFRLDVESCPGEPVFGLIYDADCMSAVDLVRRMPFTRPGAMALTRLLMPALVLGLGYYPGVMGRNSVELKADGRLNVVGGVVDMFARVHAAAARSLKREFGSLGTLLLPGSLQSFQPGAEVHYAGTLPFGRETGEDGQVFAMPGLHVADASNLPRLHAKNHTLTAMANADRIGMLIARNFRA